MRAATIALLTGLLLAPPVLAAETSYTAAPYEHLGVVIQADRIFLKKDKIYFRLRVINNTGKFMMIDKDQFQIQVAGAALSREKGVFGKYAKPRLLNPGLSQALDVEFRIGTYPSPVALVLERGIVVDSRPLKLPNFKARPIGASG